MKTTTESNITPHPSNETILVLGGTGKTGRRIISQLKELGRTVRTGSRSANPAFDWNEPGKWESVLDGVSSIYIAYHPDLAAPGSAESIEKLVQASKKHGIRKLVLLSGRGEPEAQRCERIVQESGIPSTVLRCSWFNQNFSENFLRDMVESGTIALPVGDVLEPFIDADDIADVAVAALTDDRHAGQLYEMTGPELLTFKEVVAQISTVSGKPIQYVDIPHESFLDGMRNMELPRELVDLVDYLFREVLDGRNASLGDGVQRALNRQPRNFRTFARDAFAA